MAARLLFIDPWLAVCDRCPLEDCVRGVGEIGSAYKASVTERIKPCPIFQAERRGWSAAEALARAEELKLLEPVIWLEM